MTSDTNMSSPWQYTINQSFIAEEERLSADVDVAAEQMLQMLYKACPLSGAEGGQE